MTLVMLCGGSTCNAALPVKILSFRVTKSHREKRAASKVFQWKTKSESKRCSIESYMGRGVGLRPEVQPLILLFTIFDKKRYPFRLPSINK